MATAMAATISGTNMTVKRTMGILRKMRDTIHINKTLDTLQTKKTKTILDRRRCKRQIWCNSSNKECQLQIQLRFKTRFKDSLLSKILPIRQQLLSRIVEHKQLNTEIKQIFLLDPPKPECHTSWPMLNSSTSSSRTETKKWCSCANSKIAGIKTDTKYYPHTLSLSRTLISFATTHFYKHKVIKTLKIWKKGNQ